LAITIGKTSAHGRDRGTAGLQGGSPEAPSIFWYALISSLEDLPMWKRLWSRDVTHILVDTLDLLPIAVHSVDCRSRDGVALVLNAAHTFCSCFVEWIFLWRHRITFHSLCDNLPHAVEIQLFGSKWKEIK
jgi:hypothetical protein